MFNLRNFFGFNKKVKSNKLEHLSTYSNLKSELEEINSSYEDLKLSGLIKGGAESFLNLKYEAKKEELEKRIEKAKNDLKKAVEEEVGNGGMEYLSYLGDSLGKKRSEMPQIPDEEEDRILMHFCRVGVPVTKEYPNIVDIKPSQYEFDQNIINKKIENADYKPVYFISQDNYLADGHHSWAGELEQGPHQVKVYRIGLPIRDLLRRLNLLKITFKNENNLNKSDIEIKKGIEDIVDLFEMNSGGGISNITLLNVEKIIEKRLKRDKGEIVYRYNPNELNLEKGEVETNIISPSESEKSVLTKAGGYPIGTIRHYKDGTSYKKVADTGGKGDWIKLEKVEKDPAPQLHLFHKDDVTKNPQTEQEQELVPTPTKKEFKPSKYQQAIFDFIENGEGNAVIDAVAGSGKTTTLVKALEKVPKRANTIFLAFNKSIVEELQKRTPSHVKVQTLHSLGISALFKLYGKAIKIDNYKISKLFTKAKEGWEDDEKSDGYKERVLKIVDLARYNVTKDKEALDSLCERYDIEITNKEVDRALELLGEADKDRKTFDFTDMLYVPVMENLKMDKYDYVFVDECQDLNKAQQLLFKKLLGEDSRFVACGDPYQCQPKGTKILMAESLVEKNIEDLVVGDKVVTYSSKGSHFRGLVDKNYSGEVLEISGREIKENLIKITTDSGKTSTYSHNHTCLVSLNKESEKYTVLYLMEKDGKFRIGTCKVFYNGGFGFSARVRAEKADKGWILNVYKDKNEAYIAEHYYSYKYRIPQLIFEDNKNLTTYSHLDLIDLWNRIGDLIDFKEQALNLLQEFDKFYEYPIYTIKNTGKGKKSIGSGVVTELKACNLFPEIFYVLGLGKDRYDEEKRINAKKYLNRENRYEQIISIEKEYYEGVIYSLKVSGEETYIADGIATHNSIYGFMGADVNSFHNLQNSPNTVRLPLSVSYRCPKKVVELAQTIVPHLEYHENAPEGEANLDSSISKIKAGDMVLCRNNAPIVKLCLQFIGAGKKAYVKGSDIGKNLITLVNKSKTDNLPELKDFLMKEYEGIKKKVAAKNPGLTEKEVAEHTASRSFAEKMIIIV